MFARTAARTTLRQARQTPLRQSVRGYAAPGHHTSVTPPKSDLPWIIGSALVFVPLFFSLTSPPEALKHATSPSHPDKHQDVPASTKATKAEAPEDKESSPSAAADAEEKKEAEEAGDAEKAQPEQEDKDEDKVEEGKKEDTNDAPTPKDSASHEEKKEGTPEAKAAAKEAQPGKQEKMNDAIAESKEEESKKDSE
ncbi:hypothetical protein JCM10450v2_007704 [Rhodotorula kratochvilovae]